jgi:hypothetical protein
MIPKLNAAKNYELQQKQSIELNAVQNIIAAQQNTPYALRGVNVKTFLYGLFSVVAIFELAAALYFYMVGAYGVNTYAALVVSSLLAGVMHYLLHQLLMDAATGFIFQKRHESNAMQTEVLFNMVVSIVLCLLIALVVNFFGKNGFAAYRSNQYELKTNKIDSVSTGNVQTVAITPEMLTNKKGKISNEKLETIANIAKAQTDAIKAQTDASKVKITDANAHRHNYNATTSQIVETVGASAFVLEFVLMLLAFSIVTAKKAAALEMIADASANQNIYELPSKNNPIGYQYGTTALTNELNAMRLELNALRLAQRNDNALRTDDNAMRTDDNALRTDDNALRTNDNALRTNAKHTQDDDNALRTNAKHTQDDDNALRTNAKHTQDDDNALRTNAKHTQDDDNALRTDGQRKIGFFQDEPAQDKYMILSCAKCGASFKRKTTWQIYCSDNCRFEANKKK